MRNHLAAGDQRVYGLSREIRHCPEDVGSLVTRHWRILLYVEAYCGRSSTYTHSQRREAFEEVRSIIVTIGRECPALIQDWLPP